MKTIKVKMVGFWDGMDFHKDIRVCPLFWAMDKHYDVQFCDDPDYIICSTMEEFYEYCEYPQIRILYSAENYIADFNLIDYCISPYPVSFLDRHFCLPACFSIRDRALAVSQKSRNYSMVFLKEKPYFANFITGHPTESRIRERFFEALSQYKRIESPGRYLNNRDNAENFLYFDEQKTDFQRKSKFTLCFESTYHDGFITEKILDAFYADTIPVYYGSSFVNTIFNENAFINVANYPDFDAAINAIQKLDQNDDLYLEMLRQPVFKNENIVAETYRGLEEFVCNIFDQPPEKAYRRSLEYLPKCHNQYITKLRKAKPFVEDPQNYILQTYTGRELLRLALARMNKRFRKKQ